MWSSDPADPLIVVSEMPNRSRWPLWRVVCHGRVYGLRVEETGRSGRNPTGWRRFASACVSAQDKSGCAARAGVGAANFRTVPAADTTSGHLRLAAVRTRFCSHGLPDRTADASASAPSQARGPSLRHDRRPSRAAGAEIQLPLAVVTASEMKANITVARSGARRSRPAREACGVTVTNRRTPDRGLRRGRSDRQGLRRADAGGAPPASNRRASTKVLSSRRGPFASSRKNSRRALRRAPRRTRARSAFPRPASTPTESTTRRRSDAENIGACADSGAA